MSSICPCCGGLNWNNTMQVDAPPFKTGTQEGELLLNTTDEKHKQAQLHKAAEALLEWHNQELEDCLQAAIEKERAECTERCVKGFHNYINFIDMTNSPTEAIRKAGLEVNDE